MLALLGLEALVILLLLGALIVGQPAATQDNLQRIEAQNRENVMLRATVNAIPAPTALVSKYCPPRPTC